MAPGTGTLVSINLSAETGTRKTPVQNAELQSGHGLQTDAHAGDWHRQVSLLALESIDKMRKAGLQVGAGDFAENLTVSGIELHSLPIGTKIKIGPALMEVTQIGKECHDRCQIFKLAGDCVMPREGVFARVLQGGSISPGDPVEVLI